MSLQGGGDGTGHRRGRLLSLSGAAPGRPLPSRAELNRVLLTALGDLIAGRISPAGAAAIRSAAEAALLCLERADHDAAELPRFVRAARALEELVGVP